MVGLVSPFDPFSSACKSDDNLLYHMQNLYFLFLKIENPLDFFILGNMPIIKDSLIKYDKSSPKYPAMHLMILSFITSSAGLDVLFF